MAATKTQSWHFFPLVYKSLLSELVKPILEKITVLVFIISGHVISVLFLFLSCSSRTFPRGKSKRLHFILAKRASVFARFSRLLAFDSFYSSVLSVFFFSFNKRVLCIRVYVSAQLLESSGSQHQTAKAVLKMSRRQNTIIST